MTCPRAPLAFAALLCAAGTLAPAAHAAGPPLPSAQSGRAGVVVPGGDERLITRRAGDGTTVLAVRRNKRSTVLRAGRIAGRWSIPAVTLDGATTGLSADGATLVLVRPAQSFPPTATRLAVVDAATLRLRRTIALRGFFTVDAISPDGRWAYLVQYEGDNVLDYRVRALDTASGRLRARPVVDPREPGEQMGGLPMTRASSRDGRWAYTLYSGGTETFIHALDTVGQTAACIDLDMLAAAGDLSRVRLALSADGARIAVRDAGELVASVDTRTFAVSAPGQPATARPAPAAAPGDAVPAPSDANGFPWLTLLLVCAAATAAAAGALAVARVLRRRGLASTRGAP